MKIFLLKALLTSNARTQKYTDRLNAILNSSSMTIDGSMVFDAKTFAKAFPNTSVETTDMPISNISVSTSTANFKADAATAPMHINTDTIPIYKSASKTISDAKKNGDLRKNSDCKTNYLFKTFSAVRNIATSKPRTCKMSKIAGSSTSATDNKCQKKESKTANTENNKTEIKTSKIGLKKFTLSPKKSINIIKVLNKQESVNNQEVMNKEGVFLKNINTGELENSVANIINTQCFTQKNEPINVLTEKKLIKHLSSPNNWSAGSTNTASTNDKPFTGSSMVFKKIKNFSSDAESAKDGSVKKAFKSVVSKISRGTFKHASTDSITNNTPQGLACVSTVLDSHRKKKCLSTACSRSFRSQKAIYERKQTSTVPPTHAGRPQSGSGVGTENPRVGNGLGAGTAPPCRECEVPKKTGKAFERSGFQLPAK